MRVFFREGLPPNMRFSRAASYNNPHEMFPSASKLFSGMNSVAGNVTSNVSQPSPRILSRLKEEGEEKKKGAAESGPESAAKDDAEGGGGGAAAAAEDAAAKEGQ